jgi:predicted RNase H-like HicB family nuclease
LARRSPPLAYPIRLKADADGGYVVIFLNFGVGVTQGDIREEALAQAADLIETMVANYMAEGWDLPEPSPTRGRPVVRLSPLVAAKAEVYRAMRLAGSTRPNWPGVSASRPKTSTSCSAFTTRPG